MGRYLGVGYETVSNRSMRFARQAIAMHTAVTDQLPIGEDLCADGLQSYWVSQYVPNNITVLAGSRSRFIYAAVGSSIRRSGRMRQAQQARRETLERRFRADPNGLTRAFTEISDTACRMIEPAARPLTLLDTDQHLAYAKLRFRVGRNVPDVLTPLAKFFFADLR